MDKLKERDLRLSLILGKPFAYEGFTLTPKTISQVYDIGYSEFYAHLSFLSMDRDDFTKTKHVSEDAISFKLAAKELSVLELYMLFCHDIEFMMHMTESLSVLLDVPKNEILINRDLAVIEVLSNDDRKLIDSEMYDELVSLLLIQNVIKRIDEVAVESEATDKAKEIQDKIKAYEDKIKNKDTDESDTMELSDMISAVTAKSNTISKFNVGELTLYQLDNELGKLSQIDRYYQSLEAAKWTEDIEIIHWTERL